MTVLYSPLDYVQEQGNQLVGNWTPRRGEACNGPWILGAVPLDSVLDRHEEECQGPARRILKINVREGTAVARLET